MRTRIQSLSRSLFGMVALLPSVVPCSYFPSSEAAPDPSEGVVVIKDSEDWQAALAYLEANFYAGVFREPFDSRGEALILDDDPGNAYIAVSPDLVVAPEFIGGEAVTGYRVNEAGACETFVLEVAFYDPFPGELAYAQAQSNPDGPEAALLRERRATAGWVAATLHGPVGSRALTALVVAYDADPGQTGERITVLIPLTAVEPDFVARCSAVGRALRGSIFTTAVSSEDLRDGSRPDLSGGIECVRNLSACLRRCREDYIQCQLDANQASEEAGALCRLVCAVIGISGNGQAMFVCAVVCYVLT